MKKRIIRALAIIGIAMILDETLCRLIYMDDPRILAKWGIDEQRKNMKEYKAYINAK